MLIAPIVFKCWIFFNNSMCKFGFDMIFFVVYVYEINVVIFL